LFEMITERLVACQCRVIEATRGKASK
jgi:hypothetical protein